MLLKVRAGRKESGLCPGLPTPSQPSPSASRFAHKTPSLSPSQIDSVRALGLSISAKLGITSDSLALWYKLTPHHILQNGGIDYPIDSRKIVSFFAKTTYPDHAWDDSKFLRSLRQVPSVWQDPSNVRMALRRIGTKLGVKENNLEKWYEVPAHKLGLLYRWFGSRLRILQMAYPDHKWDPQKFERKGSYHWKSQKNQRAAIELLGEKLGIKSGDYEAWYKVKGLLRLLPNAESLRIKNRYKYLSFVFPEHKWVRHKFTRSSIDILNGPPELLSELIKDLETQLGILSPEDWYEVTKVDLSRLGYGTSFRTQAQLLMILQVVYPSFDFDPTKFRFAALGFGFLYSNMVKLFGREVQRASDDLVNRGFEQVLMIPKLKVIVDYQGPINYVKQILERKDLLDLEVRVSLAKWCAENGYTLISVPFWYERELKYLLAEVYSARPELFAKMGPLNSYYTLAVSTPRWPLSIPSKELTLNQKYVQLWQKDPRFESLAHSEMAITPKRRGRKPKETLNKSDN